MAPDELRPLVELMGIIPGHRLDADHPFRQLIDAQLAEGDGDVEAAARLYAAAADSSTDVPFSLLPRHRGTAHVGAARCLIALGSLDEALPHAEAAAGLLSRWRGWRVDELVAVQRRLGIGSEPSGPAELTPREREVAALLAEGLSNAGLAERLYISPRTAAVHVSNILSQARHGLAHRGGGLGGPRRAHQHRLTRLTRRRRGRAASSSTVMPRAAEDRERQRHELVAADRAGPAATRRP